MQLRIRHFITEKSKEFQRNIQISSFYMNGEFYFVHSLIMRPWKNLSLILL